MTWEWAFLISVLFTCATIVYLREKQDISAKFEEKVGRLERNIDAAAENAGRALHLIIQLEKNNESFSKTAEEMKKVMSQANLASAISPRLPRNLG